MRDPIVEEVRRVRDELSKEFDYDLRRIFDHIKARERASGIAYCTSVPKAAEAESGEGDVESEAIQRAQH